MSRTSFPSRDAGVHVKFLRLFGKSIPPVRHVRKPSPPQANAVAGDTARKIDAIESEISAELEAGPVPATAANAPAALLAQRIDEASLLYASRQPSAAEALLLEAIAQHSGGTQEPLAWMMLLELACVADSQPQFEELALRYAQRFETSPPQWRGRRPDSPMPAASPPVIGFRGKLSDSAAPALTRFAHMAAPHAAMCIDLGGVTTVDRGGCELLLHLLENWLGEGRHVELLPAPSLASLLRSQLDAAPADANDSRWRLLIELLRFGGDASAHEDACVAYSIAHEVSPPAALLPQPLAAQGQGADALTLPAEITYPVDALLESLQAPAARLPVIVLDCSRLQLVEVNAAAPLLAGLARLANGKTVEWRDISHLVSTLLQLIGGADRLRIVNRKP